MLKLLLLFLSLEVNAKEIYLCPEILLSVTHNISFSDTEKRLVCGDKEVKEWSEIPEYLAKYNLSNFLQARGYHQPNFSKRGPVLYVEIGKQTEVRSIKSNESIKDLDFGKNRKIIGQLLTPSFLDGLGKWIIHELQRIGYICPKITLAVNAFTGDIRVDINKGSEGTFNNIKSSAINDLYPIIIRRYDAFEPQGRFNIDLLKITDDRIVSDGIVQSSNFIINCSLAPPVLEQRVVSGEPRLVTFGVGVNSEQYFLLKGVWKNARIGKNASQINISSILSWKQQKLEISGKWYFLPEHPRFYLRPLGSLFRQNEKFYETITTEGNLLASSTWDNNTIGINYAVGPSLQFIDTVRGTGKGQTRWLSLDTEININSHYFDFYKSNPSSGFSLSFSGNFYSDMIFSDLSLQKINIAGTVLYNLNDYYPPLLVLGIRGGYNITITKNTIANINNIPATFLNFLGGSQNLRGFSRQELPANGLGALRSTYLGLELRFGDFLPIKLEPFIFNDLGLLGTTLAGFNLPLYISPGLGLRIPTFIGPVRTTISKGYTLGENIPQDDISHVQFYISIGEEF